MRKILIVTLVLNIFWGAAQAEENTLLILPFDAATPNPEYRELRAGLPDILAACFSAHAEAFVVLDRSYMNALVKELGLVHDAPLAPETAARIGHMASAKYMLRGSFMVDGDIVDIQALLYETESTRLLGSGESRGKLNALVSDCGGLVRQITVALKGHANKSQPKTVSDPAFQINHFMIEGWGHYHNGEFWKAFPAFLKVLEKDPKHGTAKFWLSKSYYSAGMEDLAQVSLEEFIQQFPEHEKFVEAQQLLRGVTHHGKE